jgi:hypothetical protein
MKTYAKKNRPYCELGKLIDALARERDVRGPYNIADHLQNEAGYEVTGQGMSKYMYGKSLPKPKFLEAFAEAFKLPFQERMELAWVYAYGSRLDPALSPQLVSRIRSGSS